AIRSAALVADDAVALVAERAALAPEELEVRERLVRGGHHLEAVVRCDRERVERHLVRGERPAPDQVEHGELPHAVEVDQLPRATPVVLVDRAVRGADDSRVDALDLLVRGEEVAEGVLRAVRPEPDVRRDLREEMVTDEEDPGRLEEEAAVAGGVTGRP